ncbi:MAG: hypothetical protein UV28_C0027G0007 [Candidatus Collierbacteria bacterium GW2011_GWE2_42_48]|nr:MAG: hypothetical protein UV28_C0027G0007 [Candidatus Collierbacteria bacterium GW2011_GWE2_42_48]
MRGRGDGCEDRFVETDDGGLRGWGLELLWGGLEG